MTSKAVLRREMIKRRKAEGKKENGIKIAEKIRQLSEYKNARTVMLYMPILNEADVTSLLEDDKTFVVPVTEGDDMYACVLDGKMGVGVFNVPEPEVKTVFDKTKIDLVITPGVAFDKEFNRMGFGKGYYDRFLDNVSAVKIGVCHGFQIVDKISGEPHDVKMDMIITEDNVWSRESI